MHKKGFSFNYLYGGVTSNGRTLLQTPTNIASNFFYVCYIVVLFKSASSKERRYKKYIVHHFFLLKTNYILFSTIYIYGFL